MPREAEEPFTENLAGIGYDNATNGTAVPPLTYFQQVVMEGYSDLKSTVLEYPRGSNVLEITHNTVHYHPPAGFVGQNTNPLECNKPLQNSIKSSSDKTTPVFTDTNKLEGQNGIFLYHYSQIE